jgi:DNA repair exonuclease SbcCD ATPase subunit
MRSKKTGPSRREVEEEERQRNLEAQRSMLRRIFKNEASVTLASDLSITDVGIEQIGADFDEAIRSITWARPSEAASKAKAKLTALDSELADLDRQAATAYRTGDGEAALAAQQRRYMLGAGRRALELDVINTQIADFEARAERLQQVQAEPARKLAELREHHRQVGAQIQDLEQRVTGLQAAHGTLTEQWRKLERQRDRLLDDATAPVAPVEGWRVA